MQDQSRLTNRHGSIYAVHKLRAGDNSYIQLEWSRFDKQPSSQHERDTNERILSQLNTQLTPLLNVSV